MHSTAGHNNKHIAWTVYGKIQSITKTNGAVINYTYDASGNRISKDVVPAGGGGTTFYIRDASGNVMSIYQKNGAINNNALSQTEVSMYGSSRLGVWNINRDVSNIAAIDYSGYSGNFIRGNKFFELSNHLGNVLVTVSDKKLAVSANGTTIDYYTADVMTATDYYPFGMTMPGRKYTQGNSSYRYGMNGQEKSKELNENIYEAEWWEYDSRIGRRWNNDPIVKENESPYATFSNNPIWFKDTHGADTASGTINVFVTSPTAKNDHALKLSLKAAQDAAAKSGGNLVVLEVKNLKDLLGQMKTLTKDGAIKVNNLIIDSHGNYDKAQFKIGGTTVTSGTGADLKKLGTYMNTDGNVVLLACHAGGNTVNGGEQLLQNLSKTMNTNVWGSRSWTGAVGLFKGMNPSQMNPPRLDDDEAPKAWDYLGQWSVSTNQGTNFQTYPSGISLSKTGNVSKNILSPAPGVQRGIKAIKTWWKNL
jgi:RHS repeat-associated protein